MNIIEVKNLIKEFKSRGNKNILTGLWDPQWEYFRAIDDISFSVKKGEAVAFLGPNGAGKTTTTKVMTGLIMASSGSVQVLGYNPFDKDHKFLNDIGLVMGNKAGLNWDLTANQSFSLLRHIYDLSDSEYSDQLTKLTSMLKVEDKLDVQVRRLSLGERMKMELIGAILHGPKVLFLDEPTIGLDIDSKKAVRSFLKNLQKSGVTLVLTSHDMDDIEEVCDRVLVINEGKIVHDGDLSELTTKYSQNKYIRFHFKGKKSDLTKIKEVELIDVADGVLIKTTKKSMTDVLTKITTEYEVDDIDIISTPLEEIISDIFNS